MVVHSHSPWVGHVPASAVGEYGHGCSCPQKDGELSCTSALDLNKSVCTLNHDAWIQGHSIVTIFP